MGKYYEDLDVGETFTTPSRTITETDIALFAGLSGDFNPLHTDGEYASKTPFKRRIGHGVLTLAVATGLDFRLGIADGTLIALLGIDNLKFTAPVFPGDTVHCLVEVKEKRATSRPDRGVVVFKDVVVNQRGEKVLEYDRVLLFRRKGEGP